MIYESEGVLVKNPVAKGTTPRDWWLVLICDEGIGNYYRHILNYSHRAILRVHRPAWRTHISVVRGEEPRNKIGWDAIEENRVVRFQYCHTAQSNGTHFWLPIICEELYSIRDFLGLPRYPRMPFHMTIGVREQ